MSKKTTRQLGRQLERKVEKILSKSGFVTQIHPLTHRMIKIKGKTVYISEDNDFFNVFDGISVKETECIFWQSGTLVNVSHKRKKIDDTNLFFDWARILVFSWYKENNRWCYNVQEKIRNSDNTFSWVNKGDNINID